MQLQDAIKKRRSVRRYLDKKPDWRKILKAIDAVRYGPMAGNQNFMKIILVKDVQKISQLADASQQKFVKSAKYVVVFISNDEKVKRSYPERGEKFARQQAGAAIENFLLALVEQNLVTCWVGHFVEEQVRTILAIPDNMTVEAMFPIGLETKVPTGNKPKPDLDDFMYFDRWMNQYMKPLTRLKFESI